MRPGYRLQQCLRCRGVFLVLARAPLPRFCSLACSEAAYRPVWSWSA